MLRNESFLRFNADAFGYVHNPRNVGGAIFVNVARDPSLRTLNDGLLSEEQLCRDTDSAKTNKETAAKGHAMPRVAMRCRSLPWIPEEYFLRQISVVCSKRPVLCLTVLGDPPAFFDSHWRGNEGAHPPILASGRGLDNIRARLWQDLVSAPLHTETIRLMCRTRDSRSARPDGALPEKRCAAMRLSRHLARSAYLRDTSSQVGLRPVSELSLRSNHKGGTP